MFPFSQHAPKTPSDAVRHGLNAWLAANFIAARYWTDLSIYNLNTFRRIARGY